MAKKLLKQRGTAALPGFKPSRGAKPLFNWGSVDWQQRDVDIALTLGCSRERVRQKRKSLGIRRSPIERQNPASLALVQWIADNREQAEKVTAAEVKRRSNSPLSKGSVHKILNRLGLTRVRGAPRRFYYDKLNWELPSTDLSEIWQIPFQTVARYARVFRKAEPKWDKRFTDASTDPVYRQAVEREKRTARKYKRV